MRRLALALLLALAGCSAPDHELGRQVYNERCFMCHGYAGDAKTLAASYLDPPPRDFTAPATSGLTRERIVATLHAGRPGTAMRSFDGILDDTRMQAVAAFVTHEFVRDHAPNTAYHTEANGWPDHGRYAAAFPFATGTLALDAPTETLDAQQLAGRRLFMASCISCHDRARVADAGVAWSARPLSYPRMGFEPGQSQQPLVDAVSSASVYAKHERAPQLAGLDARERRGEALFQSNCAFCHGADGSGRNWIGQFMEPKARDLTQYSARSMPHERLAATIREGLPGTSMPGWKTVLAATEVDAVAAYVARAFFRCDGELQGARGCRADSRN